MRLHWGKTFVLGFGFLAISAVWPLYDSYMPEFYSHFIGSSTIVALLMGFDNLLGLTLQPWIGAISDRTNTRWGRRRPFLLIGMPLAAVFIIAIPFGLNVGLVALLIAALGMNLAMSLFRSPAVALMPDLTPAPQRSLANGVINLMGGIGAAVVLLMGSKLYAMSPSYPFLMSAGIMILVFMLRQLVTNPDRGTLILFMAIFAWFVGYQSVNTWFTKYSVENLGVPIQVASGALVFYAGAFVVGALPAGLIGTKFGRRPTIAAGL